MTEEPRRLTGDRDGAAGSNVVVCPVSRRSVDEQDRPNLVVTSTWRVAHR